MACFPSSSSGPERYKQNRFLGKVDAKTGIYYSITNDDQGATRQAFTTPHADGTCPWVDRPGLMDCLPQNGLGLHIDHSQGRIYASQISRPLL